MGAAARGHGDIAIRLPSAGWVRALWLLGVSGSRRLGGEGLLAGLGVNPVKVDGRVRVRLLRFFRCLRLFGLAFAGRFDASRRPVTRVIWLNVASQASMEESLAKERAS